MARRAAPSVVRILATHYVETAIRSRLFAFLVLAWVVVILGGATINSCVARQASLSRGAEATARAAYYAEIPNRRLLFQNFYTLRRPSAPLAPMATGVEYLAATYIDYRPRFSPTFYYGDDLNPLMRFCKSPDLTSSVGIVGLLIALLLCFDSVNGEISRRNAHVLANFDVRLEQIYLAKLLAHFALLALSFSLSYLASVVAFLWITGTPWRDVLGQLVAAHVLCVLYLLFAVTLFTTISAAVRRTGASFFVSIGCFVGIVYVVPYLVEATVDATWPNDYRHEDLMQDKVLFSREVHSRYDPRFRAAIEGFKDVPRDLAEIRARDAVWMGALHEFCLENSEGALVRDRRYFEQLRTRTGITQGIGMATSPFLAFSTALSVVTDTSVEAEFRMTHFAGESLFLAYRDWWLAHVKDDLDWDKTTPEKWIFAPSRIPLDLDRFRMDTFQPASWRERLSLLIAPCALLLGMTAGLILLGRWRARLASLA